MTHLLSRVGAVALLALSLLLPPTVLQADNIPERITVDQVRALLDNGEKVIFLDTRRGYSWDSSQVKLPDAVRISDNASLAAEVNSLSREEKIVTYCT